MVTMTRRCVHKHWFLLEVPWHVDGPHGSDPPLSLIICAGPHDRDAQARRLAHLGRLTVEAGSYEARLYMQHSLLVMAPDVCGSLKFKGMSMQQLIDLYYRYCLGNTPLFD